MKRPTRIARRLLVASLVLPSIAHAVYCGGPAASDGNGGGLSLQALADGPAGMLTCAAGYWAEKCGDHATAHRIYDKCIAAGYVGAMIWKALLLEDGAGVPADPVRATALLHRAATSGDADYGTLGKLHYATNLYLGRGIAKDEVAARTWFEAAAAEGSADAAEFLRTGHHTGARDQSGQGVGKRPGDLAGQRLAKVAADTPPEGPAWSLAAIAALVAAGALSQRRRSARASPEAA
ncbi:MAG: SEL1-like repeat protein [Rhodocyclaceae bacterium]|nr:SEL1-like repeat protein [Rhodocyclaceae bacterium]